MGRILAEVVAMAPGVAKEGFDVNRTRSETPVRSVGSFNPTLAIVVSSMIMTFFLVGFATGYFKRWLLGIEAAESEEFRQRQLRMMMMHNSRNKPEEDGGLDPEVVNALPLLQYADYVKQQGVGSSSPEDCPVCLSVFEGSDRVRVLPLCNHAFHSECIDAWFQLHSTCPVCRASLQPDRGHGGPPDVEVVIHDSRRAVPGLSQQEAPTTEAEQEGLPVNDGASLRHASSIRRSSSVGAGLQERSQLNLGRVVNFPVVAMDHELATASTRDPLSSGIVENFKVGARGLLSTMRWSLPNLRQLAPP